MRQIETLLAEEAATTKARGRDRLSVPKSRRRAICLQLRRKKRHIKDEGAYHAGPRRVKARTSDVIVRCVGGNGRFKRGAVTRSKLSRPLPHGESALGGKNTS